jgi:hypothetical protein
MTHDRTENGIGHQIPDAVKFPDGIEAVIQHIKGNGLKFGIYTARGDHTCQGFAASCLHELQDAAYYASIGVDFLKDDSCSGCASFAAGEGDVQTDYERMQMSIDSVGSNMSLFVEGQPDITVVYTGRFGNGRRVGHDISPSWVSMISLVDIGSGLWSYAHSDTGTGSFWNWLDFLQVGKDFFNPTTSNGTDQGSISAVAHMSIFSAMKSVLFLGNRLDTHTPETVDILTNPEVIAVNQDPLGIQARRISSTPPTNKTLPLDQLTTLPLLVKCDATDPLQQWRYTPNGQEAFLAIAPCDGSDPQQQWAGILGAAPGSTMTNKGTGECLDQAVSIGYTAADAPCEPGSPTQDFWLEASSKHMRLGSTTSCLDLFDFHGPNVFVGSCKVPGDQDSNQQFAFDEATGLVHAAGTGNGVPQGQCLAMKPITGGRVSIPATAGSFTDTNGLPDVCLNMASGSAGAVSLRACNASSVSSATSEAFVLLPQGGSADGNQLGKANYSFQGGSSGSLGWNMQFGASGPLPHSRWLTGQGGSTAYTFDPSAAGGSLVEALDQSVIDDDNVGHVTSSGGFCLGAAMGGNLEVWAGPLQGGNFTVVLLNRSPEKAVITADWSLLPSVSAPSGEDRAVAEGRTLRLASPTAGYGPTSVFAVRDVWQHADMGSFTGSYSAPVDALGAVMLVIAPVSA